MSLPRRVDDVCDRIAQKTRPFTSSWLGKIFMSFVLVGPLTFLPTVYEAWTSSNIDALRTPTWPMMTIVNTAALLAVIQCGDWRMRLVSAVWIFMVAAIYIATLVR